MNLPEDPEQFADRLSGLEQASLSDDARAAIESPSRPTGSTNGLLLLLAAVLLVGVAAFAWWDGTPAQAVSEPESVASYPTQGAYLLLGVTDDGEGGRAWLQRLDDFQSVAVRAGDELSAWRVVDMEANVLTVMDGGGATAAWSSDSLWADFVRLGEEEVRDIADRAGRGVATGADLNRMQGLAVLGHPLAVREYDSVLRLAGANRRLADLPAVRQNAGNIHALLTMATNPAASNRSSILASLSKMDHPLVLPTLQAVAMNAQEPEELRLQAVEGCLRAADPVSAAWILKSLSANESAGAAVNERAEQAWRLLLSQHSSDAKGE